MFFFRGKWEYSLLKKFYLLRFNIRQWFQQVSWEVFTLLLKQSDDSLTKMQTDT